MMYGQKLAEAMGIEPRIGGVWDQGGASQRLDDRVSRRWRSRPGNATSPSSRLADNPRTGTRQAYEKAWGDDAVFGWFSVVASYAMIARRHMHDYGTSAGAPRRHRDGLPQARRARTRTRSSACR